MKGSRIRWCRIIERRVKGFIKLRGVIEEREGQNGVYRV
jgi:hypothetical protein